MVLEGTKRSGTKSEPAKAGPVERPEDSNSRLAARNELGPRITIRKERNGPCRQRRAIPLPEGSGAKGRSGQIRIWPEFTEGELESDARAEDGAQRPEGIKKTSPEEGLSGAQGARKY